MKKMAHFEIMLSSTFQSEKNDDIGGLDKREKYIHKNEYSYFEEIILNRYMFSESLV